MPDNVQFKTWIDAISTTFINEALCLAVFCGRYNIDGNCIWSFSKHCTCSKDTKRKNIFTNLRPWHSTHTSEATTMLMCAQDA